METPNCIVEIVGEMPEELSGKSAYFGFEPSGRLHKGMLNPIAALSWVMSKGAKGIVLVADVHARLNEKEVGSEWEEIRKYLPEKAVILLQSQRFNEKEWFEAMMVLSKKVGVRRAVRAIDCAGREANESLEGVKMSSPLYALLQAVDIHCLDVDVVIGGVDQRKVHMLVRDVFPVLGWKVPVMIHTAIVLGKDGKKMSKSNPRYCEWL